MPRQTRKFLAACIVAQQHRIPTTNADFVYASLQKLNYFWDADQGVWYESPPAPASSGLIRVRVRAALAEVERIALGVAQALEEFGVEKLEVSKVYQLRPPDHGEGHVYLTFKEHKRNESAKRRSKASGKMGMGHDPIF